MKVLIIALKKSWVLQALYDGALYQATKFDAQPAIRKQAKSGQVSSPLANQMIADVLINERQQSDVPNYQFDTVELGGGPRELYVDLAGFEIDVSHYDELHGKGAGERAIAKLYADITETPLIEDEINHQDKKQKQTVDNQFFIEIIKASANWLQPILVEMRQGISKEDKKAVKFVNHLEAMLTENKVIEKYETMPGQLIYLTWIQLLDPRIEKTTKENLCLTLAKQYVDAQTDKHSKIDLAGSLAYLPPIIRAPILLYSAKTMLTKYRDYQSRYQEFSQELNDLHFLETIQFLVHDKFFTNEAKITFIKNIVQSLKQQAIEVRFGNQDIDYLCHDTMANWEIHSLTNILSMAYFDEELKTQYNKFKTEVDRLSKNPERNLTLNTELGKLVFEQLLLAHGYDAESLTPIVMHLYDDKDCRILANLYKKHGLNASEMFKRHLIELAKLTNEPNHDDVSALFFSHVFKFLAKEKCQEIATSIAYHLSAKLYAENTYAFGTIRNELFTYWLESQPEKLVQIVKTTLAKKKDFHQTPIDHFFFELSYAKMSDKFYDQFFTLLSNQLSSKEFIEVYSAIEEEHQCKFIAALIADKDQALSKLRRLDVICKHEKLSVVFLRNIIKQLKTINPDLYTQAEAEKILIDETVKDDLEGDLVLLNKILTNNDLTHDQRRTEFRRLENLNEALHNKETGTCQVVIKMFDNVPQMYWPTLFSYFDAQIIHWSFPYDEEHLRLFYDNEKDRPAPRVNTWVSNVAKWEEIVYQTFVTVLPKLFNKRGNEVAHWALTALDEALAKTRDFFPELPDKILKKFFLENLPNSIELFRIFHEQFNDKYHLPKFFNKKTLYQKVASWLPEDKEKRAAILAQLLQSEEPFEQTLKVPFVRNKEEVTLTLTQLVKTSNMHFVNLIEQLSFIRTTLFKNLLEVTPLGFVQLLKQSITDIANAEVSEIYYTKLITILLQACREADIDIFNIIDVLGDEKKAYLFKVISNIANIEKTIYSKPFKLIFSILQHYQADLLPKVVSNFIDHSLTNNDLGSVSVIVKAAQKINGNKLALPQEQEKGLIEYLTANISTAASDYSFVSFKVMASLIPNFDKLALTTLFKVKENAKKQKKLSTRQEASLDYLVKIYGFERVNAICLELELTHCQKYLVDHFEHCPTILNQIDKAITKYQGFFEKYHYLVQREQIWRFNDNLHQTMKKTIKESKCSAVRLDIAKIAEDSRIPAEAIAFMPSTTITDIKPKATTSLLTSSWERSGLINSSSNKSSTDEESQEEVNICRLM